MLVRGCPARLLTKANPSFAELGEEERVMLLDIAHVPWRSARLLEQIQLGHFIGDRIAGLGEDYLIIKARIKNSNIQKGKSAGYRVIYQVESPTRVLLLTIYAKSDRDDISSSEILMILASSSEYD